jgi:DNA-binding NarL/FixJ family response regulator
MSGTRIVIAEDHPLILKGLHHILENLCKDCEIWETTQCEQLLSIVKKEKLQYCIVDLTLSDGSSFHTIENLLKLYPDINIFVYSTFPGEIYAKRLFKIGVRGFLNKACSEEELREGLNRFLQNEYYTSPHFLQMMFNTNTFKTGKEHFDLLSTKELTVVEYLREGVTLKEIAQKMGIMPNTAATYKKRAFQKLGIENLLQLLQLYK